MHRTVGRQRRESFAIGAQGDHPIAWVVLEELPGLADRFPGRRVPHHGLQGRRSVGADAPLRDQPLAVGTEERGREPSGGALHDPVERAGGQVPHLQSTRDPVDGLDHRGRDQPSTVGADGGASTMSSSLRRVSTSSRVLVSHSRVPSEVGVASRDTVRGEDRRLEPRVVAVEQALQERVGLEGGEQRAARVGIVVALVGLGGEEDADIGLALRERSRDGRDP